MPGPTIEQSRRALKCATELRLWARRYAPAGTRCEHLIHRAANQIQREYGYSPHYKQDLIRAYLRDVGSASRREISDHFGWTRQDVDELVKHPQIEEYMPEPAGNGSKRGRLAKRYRNKIG